MTGARAAMMLGLRVEVMSCPLGRQAVPGGLRRFSLAEIALLAPEYRGTHDIPCPATAHGGLSRGVPPPARTQFPCVFAVYPITVINQPAGMSRRGARSLPSDRLPKSPIRIQPLTFSLQSDELGVKLQLLQPRGECFITDDEVGPSLVGHHRPYALE